MVRVVERGGGGGGRWGRRVWEGESVEARQVGRGGRRWGVGFALWGCGVLSGLVEGGVRGGVMGVWRV